MLARFSFVSAIFLFTLNAFAVDATRPNVVLMMADDMGMGDTSAYQDFTGNSDQDQIDTPNMELLFRRGVRFTDAHTPSTRCSPTRYALLTGRYAWRNRLKHWVLFGVQGDPMIEADRPTLGTLMQQAGYRTGLVGKWHVGLRYRNRDGDPAAEWLDADLKQPMFDTPLDHGFDYCRFTSRSHGTSGPASDSGKKNGPGQSVGPGHIHGRDVVGATDKGKELVEYDRDSYVLHELGSRHLRHAKEFLKEHMENDAEKPFFLYYPSNSNHGPYTPSSTIADQQVAAFNKAGERMEMRHDYIFENDLVLGELLKYLDRTDDPRSPDQKLIENTIVIFTSDNGAEKDLQTATGPFRSHKGSCYEGGHRVPFIVSWPAGGVGDGVDSTPGQTNDSLIGLHDMYATFAELMDTDLPNLREGEKGAEDSVSVLSAWRGATLGSRPMFYHDHKQSKRDPAVSVLRIDDPLVSGNTVSGKWKLFFDASLLRKGTAIPIELYDLATDREEKTNLLETADEELVEYLSSVALKHRTTGGHRLADGFGQERISLRWTADEVAADDMITLDLRDTVKQERSNELKIDLDEHSPGLEVTLSAMKTDQPAGVFEMNAMGMGIAGGNFSQVDTGEYVEVQFNRDVLIESVAVVAGRGVCGGFYTLADQSPIPIYCIDADIDAKDQSGILSDIGVLKSGQTLKLQSGSYLGAEKPGRWRLGAITFRPL